MDNCLVNFELGMALSYTKWVVMGIGSGSPQDRHNSGSLSGLLGVGDF